MSGSISVRQSVLLPTSGPAAPTGGPITMTLRKPGAPKLGVARSDPLSQGLVLCALPIQGGFLDLVTGMIAPRPSVTTFHSTLRPQDPTAPYQAYSSSAAFFPAQTLLDKVTGPYTIFIDGCLENNASFAVSLSSYDSTNGKGMYLFYDDSLTVVNTFVLSSFNTGHQNAGSVLGANSELYGHRIMVTADGTNWKFYAGGILVRTVGLAELPAASVLRQTYLGNGGSVAAAYAWNRVLTADEYRLLWDNPKRMLTRETQIAWGAR